MPISLTHARIVTRHTVFDGTVDLEQDRIAMVSDDTDHADEVIDLQGDYLLPGLIELHTDNLERHLSPRPQVHWPALSAVLAHDTEMVAAGITTVFNALSAGAIASDSPRLELFGQQLDALEQAHRAGLLRGDHRLHLRCEVGYRQLQDLWDRHVDHPLLGLVSLMDHTPGQRQYHNIDDFKAYYQSKNGTSDTASRFIMQRRSDSQTFAAANRERIAADCHQRRLPLASHDDTTVGHVEDAARLQARIMEFPTTLAAATASRDFDMTVLAGAPNLVRGGSHSGNVAAQELAEQGLLDMMSSDYVPHSLLMAVFRLPQLVPGYDLPQAVATASSTPARLAGLTDRGEIAVGKRADLIQVRLHGDTPQVRAVWREGRRVF